MFLWSCSTMPVASGWTFSRFTRLMAGCLVLSLVQEPLILLAAPMPGWHGKKTLAKSLTEEERATHALNRLTVGPRPGDLERLQAIGVKRWIEMQLHPEQIDDSLLDARLQSFPAMHLSQQDLMQTFPSAGVIRAVADGRIALPKDRVEHAIYQNQVLAYDERRQKQAQEAAKLPAAEPVASPAPNQMAANEGLMADAIALEDVASSPSIAVHEQ